MLHLKLNDEHKATHLLTRDDLCQRLKISKRTVSRLMSTGKLPAAVRLGHSVRWRSEDIDEWIGRGCPAMDRNGKSR